jgi:hypothetical protein
MSGGYEEVQRDIEQRVRRERQRVVLAANESLEAWPELKGALPTIEHLEAEPG